MPLRPLKNKIIAFHVPVRRKVEGSLLYKGDARSGMYSRCEEAWIVSLGPNCKLDWHRGQKVFVSDGFELDVEPGFASGLWDELKDQKDFAQLKGFSESVDGDVATTLITEWSIIATED